MSLADQFPNITLKNESLAPYTHLKIGGPAEYFVQPTTVDDLRKVMSYCQQNKVPLRMLGGGYNLLVREQRVPGAVMRLAHSTFNFLEVNGRTVKAGGGGQLFDLVAFSIRAGLRGLETLAGIRGTVGGSVRCNVGDRSGEIGSCVRRVAVLTDKGSEEIRTKAELNFGDHSSDLDEPVILWVEFELNPDNPEAILKRLRKAWVRRKAAEPLTSQTSVRVFRDPPGQSAAKLIEQSGLSKIRVGGAEVSDRNGAYIVATPGTTAVDVLQLTDLVKDKVKAMTGVALDREVHVW